jgi:predicted nucleic acid-binding protein
MSWMNLGEVFYVTARATGTDSAQRLVAHLRRRLTLDDVTVARVLDAAAIKASHPMAFADAFALAAARAHDAVLLTGDPEILDIRGDWEVEDLRAT